MKLCKGVVILPVELILHIFFKDHIQCKGIQDLVIGHSCRRYICQSVHKLTLADIKFMYEKKVILIFQEAVPISPVNLKDQAEIWGSENQRSLNSYNYHYFEEANIAVSVKSLNLCSIKLRERRFPSDVPCAPKAAIRLWVFSLWVITALSNWTPASNFHFLLYNSLRRAFPQSRFPNVLLPSCLHCVVPGIRVCLSAWL